MKTVVNEELFDSMQMEMLSYLIRGVKEMLEEADLEEEQVMSISEDVAFTVSCIIDSSTVMEFEGKPLSPCLTFVTDGKGEEAIISENGSWMHEYAFGMARDFFSEGESKVEEIQEDDAPPEFSENLSVGVTFTYRSGVKVLHDLGNLMSQEFEIADLADSHFYIIDPTADCVERSTRLRPSEISPLFEELIEVNVIDNITDKVMKIDPLSFMGANFTRIYLKVIEACIKGDASS